MNVRYQRVYRAKTKTRCLVNNRRVLFAGTLLNYEKHRIRKHGALEGNTSEANSSSWCIEHALDAVIRQCALPSLL